MDAVGRQQAAVFGEEDEEQAVEQFLGFFEQQQAVDRFTEIINDKSTPVHLLPYLKYARAQAIMGGRLSSLPGLNADIMMMQGMGGGLGGSPFGDINSGNEW